MFSIFRKSRKYDLAWLGVDMHSHLLPGIDDGCADVQTSLDCITGLQELGYHTFYATPHVFSEVYPNNGQRIQTAHDQLRKGMQQRQDFEGIKVHAAAEYMIDDEFSKYYATQNIAGLLTLPENHILIEMSYQYERQDFYEQIFQLQLRELKPILAHPERYNFYHSTREAFRRIKDRGCKFQLNLLSLSGYYGERTRKMAQHLVREGMIDFVGTDLHHIRHMTAIRQFATTNDLQKFFEDNPLKNESWQG